MSRNRSIDDTQVVEDDTPETDTPAEDAPAAPAPPPGPKLVSLTVHLVPGAKALIRAHAISSGKTESALVTELIRSLGPVTIEG